MPANSLFELRKTTAADQVSHAVRTVNFQNDEVVDPDIQTYFQSRIYFLQACYEFAKEAKLKEDFDFADDAKTKTKLENWLIDNQRALMVAGTEFGVITTKVIESISGINNNQYLKKLAEDVKLLIFQKINPDFKPKFKPPKKKQGQELTNDEKVEIETQKRLQAELKDFQVSFTHLNTLTEGEIKQIFNYQLVQKAQVLWQLVKLIEQEEVLTQETESLQASLSGLVDRAEQAWAKALGRVQETLKNEPTVKGDLAKFFVLKLYFAFDGEMRTIEEDLLPGINSRLNSLRQHFAQEILEKNPDNYQQSMSSDEVKKDEIKAKNSLFQKIWNLNWTDPKSPETFQKLYQKILQGDKLTKEDYPSVNGEEAEFFLRHPKSAPSFPSLKDRQVSWDQESQVSLLLQDRQTHFNTLKFLDFLLVRAKKIIEGSEVYKVWRHLGNRTEFEWVRWLEWMLGQESPDFQIEPTGQKITKHEEGWQITSFQDSEGRYFPMAYKQKKSETEPSKVQIARFVWPDGKLNRRLPELVFRLDGDGQPRTTIGDWLWTRYLDLSKFNVEIGVLRGLQAVGLLDLKFVYAWSQLLTSEIGQQDKLAVNTQKRLLSLSKSELPTMNKDAVVEFLIARLKKLEWHLLLNSDHQEYKIFDKTSFNKYKKLAQVVFEACLPTSDEVAKQKTRLAELAVEKPQVLPIKIGRMTNRTNGNSTLVFDLDEELNLEFAASTSKKGKKNKKPNASVVFPLIKLQTGSESIIIRDSLEKILKEKQKLESKDKYAKIAVGFLNGDGDNNLREIQSRFFANQKTFDGLAPDDVQAKVWYDDDDDDDRQNGFWFVDKLVRPEDMIGGNNPGYPKLFFFLIPKDCNNLLVQVETNSYYLTKYTPYHHLREYLELEKELLEAKKTENESLVEDKAKQILQLRAKLRHFYRLSSLELDLIRDYRLKPSKQGTSIESYLQAKVHFQFSNPRRIYNQEALPQRPEYVLSVDLGEKILAAATLSKINWQKFADNDFKLTANKENYALRPVWQSFLPLAKKDLETALGLVELDSAKKLSEDTQFKQELDGVWQIPAGLDRFHARYTRLIDRYKAQQRQFGVVHKNLAKAKKNLTDKLAEQIAAQIVKLAHRCRAVVVFEDLSAGFGRQVEAVRLYTQIRRLTAQKLGEVGLLDTSFVKGEADLDKYARYEFNKGLFSLINPSYTSKTCSSCGYVPVLYKPATGKRVEVDGVKMLGAEDWKQSGQLKFVWNEKVYTVLAPSGLESLKVVNWQGKEVDLSKLPEVFSKKNTSTVKKTFLEAMRDREFLFSTKTEERKVVKDGFDKFFLNTVLQPRPEQKEYCCPFCGNEANADYQASYNIGLHFLVGYKIVQERQAVDDKSKSGIVEEVRGRLRM